MNLSPIETEIPMAEGALARLVQLRDADRWLPVVGPDWVLAKNGYAERQMRLGRAHARVTDEGRWRLHVE